MNQTGGKVMRLRWPDVQDGQQFLRRYIAPAWCAITRTGQRRSLSEAGIRDADWVLLSMRAEMTRRQVTEAVASSTGNHGAAVAYAAKLLDLPAKIFLPVNANPTKQARIRACGAEIAELAKDISQAFEERRLCQAGW